MRARRHLTTTIGFSAAMVVLTAMPGPARANYGIGMGMGWGWGGFGNQPSASTQFLNQHALTRAAAGPARAPSHSPYAGNPNSYINRIRDNGFVSHFDVRRRRGPSYQTGRTDATANRRGNSQPVSPAAIVPLDRFFDAAYRLVWPHESPVDGDFQEKREISDRAALAVLREKQQQGVASISGATRAREKLLDYGRPALQQLRSVATPPIADSFNRFLLSLYDSLEAAVSLPGTGRAASP